MNTGRKLRTLLVDDEALSRRGLQLRLRMVIFGGASVASMRHAVSKVEAGAVRVPAG